MTSTPSMASTATSISSTSTPKNIETNVNITMDAVKQTFSVPPIIADGRTMVPVRFISEQLGAKVDWQPSTPNMVTITKGDKTIVLDIGSDQALVGTSFMKLDVPAFTYKDRTMVPLRFVSDALDEHVNWDDKTRTVVLQSYSYEDTVTYYCDDQNNLINSPTDAALPESVTLTRYRLTGDPTNRFHAIQTTSRAIGNTQYDIVMEDEGTLNKNDMKATCTIKFYDHNTGELKETDSGTWEQDKYPVDTTLESIYQLPVTVAGQMKAGSGQ